MTPQFKTFLKILVVISALIGAHRLARQWALGVMPHVDRCGMPCQWEHDKGFLSCQPLTAALEIKTTPEPKGRGRAVWFRVTTTNRSCRTILLHTEFYAPHSEYYGQLDDLMLTDEKGRRVRSDKSNTGVGMLGIEKRIHPYIDNNSNVSPLIRTKKTYQGEDRSFIYLDPGQAVATGSTELAPYRMKYVDVETKDYRGTAAVPEPVLMENPERVYAAPPPGFRRLIGFDLHRPGRYKAQFVLQQERVFSERFDDPSTPFRNKWRRIVYWLATSWKGDRGSLVKIDVSSAPVEFEIEK